MDAFAERHRVVRYDLRGFGESPLPGGPFSYVADLRALLDELEIEQAAVVGNSLGGKVALELALTHPERVSALVLVGAALGGAHRSAELEAFGEAEDALLETGDLDEAVELNLRTWLDGPRRERSPVDVETRRWVGAMQRRAFEVLLRAHEMESPPGPVEWLDPPGATRLAEIVAPTLVVVGEEDLGDFIAIADLLAELIPGARKVVVRGAAHLPGVERPEELNRVVLEFLEGVSGSSASGYVSQAKEV
jgi:3-oxoadipate enol-lactonase